MPRLREFAALPSADPLRGVFREELILAFLPVVEHLARCHARQVTASVQELTQVGTVALITAIDRWDSGLALGRATRYWEKLTGRSRRPTRWRERDYRQLSAAGG